MQAEYDPGADALYVYLDEPANIDHTVEVDSDYLMVDVDQNGRAVGIEVLVASKGFDLARVIERFGLQGVQDELERIQQREFLPDLAWKKAKPTA